MGDLNALAANMRALGLLHPIVVAPDGLLLCALLRNADGSSATALGAALDIISGRAR